ncbi:hypothetical protein C8Q80DRAFT_1341558 [Daedaleopsis nitida]|nr:hypothetical protein C8Q80DRAFT_1341558 [Daedaleopsis nitida]
MAPCCNTSSTTTAATQAAKAKDAAVACKAGSACKPPAKPAPPKPSPEKATRAPCMSTGGCHPRGKAIKMYPDYVDSEAEEVEDKEDELDDDAMDANDWENSELMSSHNIESDEEYSADDSDSTTTQNDQSSNMVIPSEENEPDTLCTNGPYFIHIFLTKPPSCGRKADNTDAISPSSPSPVKSSGAPTPVKAGATTPSCRKGTNAVFRCTPGKRAKEEDSDDQEEQSPMKKTRTSTWYTTPVLYQDLEP